MAVILTVGFFVHIIYSGRYRLCCVSCVVKQKRTKACIDESDERLELFAYHCLFSQDLAGGVEGAYLK